MRRQSVLHTLASLRVRMGLFMACWAVIAAHAADMPPEEDSSLPRALKEGHFEQLLSNSPFTRSLGGSDSLILTGIVKMDKELFATLLDTKTMESHLVSKKPNHNGWQLIGISGQADRVKTWSAKIQIAGGEIFAVRYQTPPPRPRNMASKGSPSNSSSGGSPSAPLTSSQITEAKQAAENYKEGFTSDGYPRQPPPEMVAKLSRLSVSQREDINRQMISHRNQGLGMEERRKIYENLVDRSMQGRR